ncbi:type I 3-dehydroquinate dehydratase [Curtobacterium ammoniigenes]|uniref:type I 3-dehydroquinate dehydratase n=1 Tax=Curtobacterium ammoniigenes TaxID=395387 RepID=UPI00082CE741|nr:type I 3-dehydroquinate dehydratase [Curtobacterium ammoniigenes]
MTTATIGRITLEAGRTPAICVPLAGAHDGALRDAAALVRPDVADVVELRLDQCAAHTTPDALGALRVVRAALASDIPVIVTYRSAAEGGAGVASPDEVRLIMTAAMETGAADAIDVEQSLPTDTREALVTAAHEAGVPVVMSAHDFRSTPAAPEILERLRTQQRLGADVAKVAVMPQRFADVLALLEATAEFASAPTSIPAITMSMGRMGILSRLAGETVGSVMTFGRVGSESAPGQLDAAATRLALHSLHAAIAE